MYWKKFTLTDRDVIQRVCLPIQIFIRGEPGEEFEVVDKMRLIVIAAFQRNLTPANRMAAFNGVNRFLKSHNFEVLLGCYAHLLPEQVEDIYFTGALSDPRKTEFFVEYRDQQGRWRRYTPDFVVRTKDDRALIVEVKREHDRDHPVDGQNGVKAMQLRKWEELNPERLKYQIVFTDTDGVSRDDLTTAAVALGISPHTAKTHLKAILRKTDSRRQAELLHCLNGIASLTSRLPD